MTVCWKLETFTYDHMNRLTDAVTTGGTTRSLEYDYDLRGNLTGNVSDKSGDLDVTDYSYTSGTHRLSSATVGGVGYTMTHDSNGAITQYDIAGTSTDKYLEYNSANQPTKIVLGTSLSDSSPEARDEFLYGPDGERIFRRSSWKVSGSTRTAETYYMGQDEATYYTGDPSVSIVHKARIGQNVMRVRVTNNSAVTYDDYEFAHRDHLGSINKVTNGSGAVLRVQEFEPFGMKKAADWQGNMSAGDLAALLVQTANPVDPIEVRGFTDHEHLERTGFIHMNGRLYDPNLGRFLSPDPIVQAPGYSQSWNGYSYVMNSPLSFMDPSGYAWVSVCSDGTRVRGFVQNCPPGSVAIRTFEVDDADLEDALIPEIETTVPRLPPRSPMLPAPMPTPWMPWQDIFVMGGGGPSQSAPTPMSPAQNNQTQGKCTRTSLGTAKISLGAQVNFSVRSRTVEFHGDINLGSWSQSSDEHFGRLEQSFGGGFSVFNGLLDVGTSASRSTPSYSGGGNLSDANWEGPGPRLAPGWRLNHMPGVSPEITAPSDDVYFGAGVAILAGLEMQINLSEAKRRLMRLLDDGC